MKAKRDGMVAGVPSSGKAAVTLLIGTIIGVELIGLAGAVLKNESARSFDFLGIFDSIGA